MTDEDEQPACERCGAPLPDDGEPPAAPDGSGWRLCAHCAGERRRARPPALRGLNLAAIVLSIGAFVLLLSVFADWLGFGRSEGFGRRQELGLGLAALLLVIGALLRVATISVIALAIGGLTLLADWLGFGNAPGFGAQQRAGCVVGALLLLQAL